ncbi:hypothetical protein B0T22DRAFT_441704 [Podospora appendiculata]|uniref:Uncharacterized protein n=1 Tax=Podospora appendiculata TaxID=314037 RepID=A0AAE0XCU8_9PEZI|nr:hypothetical protein B0T22DRAFT_441704 [Podospora appendiculata]
MSARVHSPLETVPLLRAVVRRGFGDQECEHVQHHVGSNEFDLDDHLGYIRAILLEIDNCMQKDETYTHPLTAPVARGMLLPVITDSDTATADTFGQKFDSLLTPGSELFIADSKPLLDSFIGLVPLLAFGIDDTSRMKRLIHGLGMDARCLSQAHASVPKTSGTVEFDRHLTEWFQSRYEFIARVKLGGAWKKGRERPGNVVLSPSDDERTLKIYVKAKYLSPTSTPFELVELLALLTSIHEREEGKCLLHMILAEQDLGKILAILENKGVP